MHSGESTTYFGAKVQRKEVDQLGTAIDLLKNNPQSRRIIISAWNPGELDQMALPPCHILVQFYLSNDRKLSCQMYQRSVDSFLGLPFNIASYALLTHMIAREIGSAVGKLTLCLGDTHLYKSHIPAVKEQMTRTTFKLPKLVLTNDNIFTAKMDDITLENYVCHPSISAPMAV
jgi:thymidylate synthase